MFKKSLLLTIIFVSIFSICGYAADYRYTQESGANFFVSAADKSDALEDTNELRQIVEDIGTLIGHSLNDDSYPKDGATGGTAQYTGDGSLLTGVAAIGFILDIRADDELKKGDPVYISGTLGAARPKVKLVDADDVAKIRMAGIAETDIANGANGIMRVHGLLTNVATLGVTDANPGDEGWGAGDILYCTLDGGGGYTNIRPTSGRIIKAAYTLLGAHNIDTLLILAHVNAGDMAAAAGEDIRLRLGADDGTTDIHVKNFSNVLVASIDDEGDADFNSLILDTALPAIEGGTGKATITADSFLKGAAGNTYVERTYAQVKQDLDLEIGTDVLAQQSIGITDNYLLEVDGSPSNGEYAKFTANGLEGRTYAQMMKDITPITTSSSTNTLTVDEAGLVLVSDAHTETLPTAVGNAGLTYHFVKTDWDYDLITLEGDGAETFNYENSTGSPNLTYLRLNTPLAEVTIVSDNSNWQVINEAMGQVPFVWAYNDFDLDDVPDNVKVNIYLSQEVIDIGDNFNNSIWVSGTADGLVADHLQDDGAGQFVADMNTAVAYVKNVTDGTYAWITAFNDVGDVTLSKDIFDTGNEAYEIYYSRFIAPVAGRYQILVKSMFEDDSVIADKKYYNRVYVNFGLDNFDFTHSAIAEAFTQTTTYQKDLSKDDFVEFRVSHYAGVGTIDISASNQAETNLQIYLISKN